MKHKKKKQSCIMIVNLIKLDPQLRFIFETMVVRETSWPNKCGAVSLHVRICTYTQNQFCVHTVLAWWWSLLTRPIIIFNLTADSADTHTAMAVLSFVSACSYFGTFKEIVRQTALSASLYLALMCKTIKFSWDGFSLLPI